VVTTQVETRLVCPAELDQAVPNRPTPADDAKIAANASGNAYLAALVVWGEATAKLFSDAADDCHSQVAPPAGVGQASATPAVSP
jgi:hypothetical protein